MFIKLLRRNIGTIVAVFAFILITILTLGDIGDVLTANYWHNVYNNLTSIGYMTVALTALQVILKQGLGEQALQKGMNTERTTQKYEAHRTLIGKCQERLLYLPYFLQIRNERETNLKRREFLINNGFTSEKKLYESGMKKLIKKYESIRVHLTTNSIKWTTTTVKYDKQGNIETLQKHRVNRALKGTIMAAISMLATTLITDGLFFAPSDQPIWQKFVRLLSYIITIAISSVMSVVSEYEKGAFGIPNELDDVNEIWHEFENWEIPEWVLREVEETNMPKEVDNERRKETINSRANIQKEQEQSEGTEVPFTYSVLDVHTSDCNILYSDDTKQCRQYQRDNSVA